MKLSLAPAVGAADDVTTHAVARPAAVLQKLRLRVALMVETGEAREVHDLCCLLGYGADAISPYLVFDGLSTLRHRGKFNPPMDDKEIYTNYVAAAARGISKVMAKMGISTLHSYKGAQIFEAVGLHANVIDKVRASVCRVRLGD